MYNQDILIKKYELYKDIIIGKMAKFKLSNPKGINCDYETFVELEKQKENGDESLKKLINYYAKYDVINGKCRYNDPYIAYISIKWIRNHYTFASLFGTTEFYDVAQDILSDISILDTAFENFIYYLERERLYNTHDYSFDNIYNYISDMLKKYFDHNLDEKSQNFFDTFFKNNKEFILYSSDFEMLCKLYLIKLFESKQYYTIMREYTDSIINKLVENDSYRITKIELKNAFEYCKLCESYRQQNKKLEDKEALTILDISKLELINIKKTLEYLSKNKIKKLDDYQLNKRVDSMQFSYSPSREEVAEEFKEIENNEIEKIIDALPENRIIDIIKKFSENEFKEIFKKEKKDCTVNDIKDFLRRKLKAGESLWL